MYPVLYVQSSCKGLEGVSTSDSSTQLTSTTLHTENSCSTRVKAQYTLSSVLGLSKLQYSFLVPMSVIQLQNDRVRRPRKTKKKKSSSAFVLKSNRQTHRTEILRHEFPVFGLDSI